MARSATSSICGVNLQKLDGARLSDLNVRTFVLYDESAAFAPELRQRVPDALILLRLIQNYRWEDPETTAYAGADLIHRYPQVDYLTPANEQNLENGADSPAIAAWCDRFRAEWERQGYPRPLVTPAVSPGRPYDLNALKASWDRWEKIGVHGYTTLEALDYAPALAVIQQHRAVWPGKSIQLTEFNIEKLEETTYRHQEGANATDAFLRNLAAMGYIEAAMWFLDDAHTDEWKYRLVRIPPLYETYKRIGHETGGNPHPEPPQPQPPSTEIALIESIYGITHTDTADIYLASLSERTDPPEISAHGPAETTVLVSTADDQHQARGSGYASLAFSHPAQYQPVSQGEKGFYYATCAGARVNGLGWAYDAPPVLQGPHVNVVPTFARRQAPPNPGPSGHVWGGDFARFAAEHPEVGQPIGPLAYLPQDTEPWPCCAQVSATHCLVWNGFSTFAIHR